jgi:hypothetical protein
LYRIGTSAILRDVQRAVGGFPESDQAEASALMKRLRAHGVNPRRREECACVCRRSHADTIIRRLRRAPPYVAVAHPADSHP